MSAKTKKAPKATHVPVSDWGKDHWSLLLYLECRCVDNRGELDYNHLRTNTRTHPHLVGPRVAQSSMGSRWNPSYGTKLRGYFGKDKIDVKRQMIEHDDWDCFYDIEAAGFIEDVGTGFNPAAKMTKAGSEICGQLRAHKAAGGHCATFAFPVTNG